MKIPLRIILPVAGAVVFVCILLGVFFLQLEGTRVDILSQLQERTGSGTDSFVQFFTQNQDDPIGTADTSLLHLRQGDLLALRGEWAEAEVEYNEAVLDQGGISALRKLAEAQLQQKKTRQARETMDNLKRQGADQEETLLLESMILLYEGELGKARELLDAASDSPHKHYGLGLLAIMRKDPETSKQELSQVAGGWDPVLRTEARTLLAAYEEYALFPDSPAVHLDTLLSRALAQVHRCELALPILSSVTTVQSDYRDAWTVQGFCELTTGRTVEALSSLEQAYRLDPEKPQIQYFLARTYSKKGDHGNAVTFLRYALKNGFTPEEEVRQLLAKEALKSGNTALAIEQFDALTQSENVTEEIYEAYITAMLETGRKEEATVKLDEGLKKWPGSKALLMLQEKLQEAE